MPDEPASAPPATAPASDVSTEWRRQFESLSVREARITARAQAAAPAECALAEELLIVYFDLLGAVEEDDRLVWPSDEARLAAEACLVRLYDDLLATWYLVLRGMYLQACRIWLDYLEALWLLLYFVREPSSAETWLRRGAVLPLDARRTLAAAGQLTAASIELYTQLDQQSNPRTKAGYERALSIRQGWGEWQLHFFLGGEGNSAWLRRAIGDWLFIAALGLAEFDALGVAPPAIGWSRRAAAAVAAVRARLGVDFS